ncbi:MAG TPA: Ig-like domain-containing protein [Candidatus Angelobacter sp.]|nr:Ig-like domain-containing protein [Candidatus Angelobacter sp.]
MSFAGVTINSPANGSTVTSPVHVVASASSSNPITSMRIYVDNVSVYNNSSNRIDTSISMAPGSHLVVVQAWDSKGTVFKSQVNITVSQPGAVTISSPANGATVASPVHVVASASSSNPITSMQIYVDNVSVYGNPSNKIDTLVSMAAGSHTVVVQAWDSTGAVFKAQAVITVPAGVTITAPRNGATAGSPVHVLASASSANPITTMRIYLDNVSVYTTASNKIDTQVAMATGNHNMVVQAWDSTGAVFKTPVSVTVNPTTTLTAETSNNTSAADSFAAQSNGNAGAGNVSKVATRTLLYPGSTAKIYAHFVPWFGSPKHMNVGYVSNDSQQVKDQVSDMISRGLNGTIIDWYGAGQDDSDFLTFDKATQLMMHQAEANTGFTFATMYDEGALAVCAKTSGCDVTQRMISDLNYANVTYWGSPAYQKSGGRPVVYFFENPQYTINWSLVRASVAGNPLFLFRNYNGFTQAQSDGGFSWISPEFATTNDPAALAYLDSYYNAAVANPGKKATASAYPGFDDSLAAWGTNRKINQQCGQTWLQTLGEAGTYYSTSNQMSGIQLVTWNDYEEGTEIETGIDNCVTVNASVTGTVVSWSITGQASTLDHFSVYVTQGAQNLLWLKDTAVSASSMDLAQFNLDAGTYTVYIKAVAKPSLTNKMSSGVQMTVR